MNMWKQVLPVSQSGWCTLKQNRSAYLIQRQILTRDPSMWDHDPEWWMLYWIARCYRTECKRVFYQSERIQEISTSRLAARLRPRKCDSCAKREKDSWGRHCNEIVDLDYYKWLTILHVMFCFFSGIIDDLAAPFLPAASCGAPNKPV